MAECLTTTVAGLILAGGRSTRMGGGAKGLRTLAGRPMIRHVIDRLAPQVGPLAINANAAGFEGFDLPVLADPVAGHPGPLAGLLAGLRWAAGLRDVTHLLSVPGDAPFLPADLVPGLARAAAPGQAAIARSATGLHPVVGLWPVTLATPLARWLETGGSPRVRLWAEHCGAAVCDFPVPEDGPEPFFNVNTPEDLAEAEGRAARA